MRRVYSVILVFSIVLSGCAFKGKREFGKTSERYTCRSQSVEGMNQDLYDEIYAVLEKQINSDEYDIDTISSVYLSKEYIEEKLYNSKENSYFGYTLSEINSSFEGEHFVFAPDENGNTIVKEFEVYDDTLDQIIRNIGVGTGVILVCATLSVVTGFAGMTAVSVVLAFSAKTAAITALEAAAVSSVISGVVTGYQTRDFGETVKAMALSASKGYKVGAIIGAVKGAVTGAVAWNRFMNSVPEPREAELMALEEYPGEEQINFLEGKVVPQGTEGATRPDIVRIVDDHLEAIEVKRYDLVDHLDDMINVLRKQVSSRVINLPEGSTQRIVLNVYGRGYSDSFLEEVILEVKEGLFDIYPDIPVDIMG
ncbi:MAG: hypothetical protein J5636_00835 [Clostridiales bacterium]|nr:hypothetical protein [Clostridiales bacterium]